MRYRRRGPLFLGVLAAGLGAAGLMVLHAARATHAAADRVAVQRRLVAELGLTDLCLFTDARYTRHPSMADVNSAFQDHPLSFEHFPSGSLLSPPAHLKGHGTDR